MTPVLHGCERFFAQNSGRLHGVYHFSVFTLLYIFIPRVIVRLQLLRTICPGYSVVLLLPHEDYKG